MISIRTVAIFVAATLLLFLLFRPVVGGWGAPTAEIQAPKVPRALGPAPAGTGQAPAVAPQHLEGVARAIFAATNEERTKKGLGTLEVEPRLAEIAEAHCDDMLARRFFDHVDPDGVGPADRVAAKHRRLIGLSAENVWMSKGQGFTTTDDVALGREIVRNWMGSTGHRENILKKELTHLGVGVSRVGDEMRATQLFAEAWAYLEADMPVGTARGTQLVLPAARPWQQKPAPNRIDLYLDGFARWGPQALVGSQVEVAPGDYRSRFYFPMSTDSSGSVTSAITFGPSFTVQP